MPYVMMLPFQVHPPRFHCKDDPAARDSERPEEESSFYLGSRGLPLPLDRFPKKATLISSHKTIDDVLYAATIKWAVSERVRDVFETYAPGQVELVPANLSRRAGRPINAYQYFYINSLTGLRTVQWDRVSFRHTVHPNGWREVEGGLLCHLWPGHGLQVDRTGHEDIKVWHELDAGKIGTWIFTSDDVMQALAKIDMTGPEVDYVPEISHPEGRDETTAPAV